MSRGPASAGPLLLVLAALTIFLAGCGGGREADATSGPASARATSVGQATTSPNGSEHAGADTLASLGVDPGAFRDRWNRGIQQAFGRRESIASHLDLGPPSVRGTSVTWRAEAATVTGEVAPVETLTSLQVRVPQERSGSSIRDTVAIAYTVRLLIASTLPSEPSAGDGRVADLAADLSVVGSSPDEDPKTVVEEGLRYTAQVEEGATVYAARVET